jgi:hypothetical protein
LSRVATIPDEEGLATWLTSANVIMVSGHGRGFSVQKNLALTSVLAGQSRNIYAELQ